jgi:hypothetical protein
VIDLSTWLTTSEVCARLGISERTLEREVYKGKWQSQRRPREGKKPERVFSPHEVAMREPPPVREVTPANRQPNTDSVAKLPESLTSSPEWQAWHVLGPRLLDALVAQKPPATPALFCSLEEASEITGFTVWFLKRMVRAGKLRSNRGGPRGALRVRREDLKQDVFFADAVSSVIHDGAFDGKLMKP